MPALERSRSEGPAFDALFFDADDTLWENAIHFDAAREAFVTALSNRGVNAAVVRTTLDGVEAEHLKRKWFGSKRLAASMVAASRLLLGNGAHEVSGLINGFARSIAEHPIRFYPCAVAALIELRRFAPLVLVTMGDPEEQSQKIVRSGIAPLFRSIEIVPDKDTEAYREILSRHGFTGERTWMIGNNKKKDVDAAMAAGLRAAWVRTVDAPHLGGDAPAGRPDMEIRGIIDLLPYFGVGAPRAAGSVGAEGPARTAIKRTTS